jgi:hypothetical protein
MPNKNYRYFWLAGVIVLAAFGFYLALAKKAVAPTVNDIETAIPTPEVKKALAEPMVNALGRVTKKPFSIKISPQTSPVQPERFSGYHTGVDFETTADEQKVDVPIYAICEGKLLLKKYATGYGGVAVQACKINNQDATIVYGHLRLTSITAKLDQNLKVGEQLAVLGTGFSKETDNERKHLHLGLHLGKTITLLGYAQNKNQLNQWLDFVKLSQ